MLDIIRETHGSFWCWLLGHDMRYSEAGDHCHRCGMPAGWLTPPSPEIPARLRQAWWLVTYVWPRLALRFIRRHRKGQ